MVYCSLVMTSKENTLAIEKNETLVRISPEIPLELHLKLKAIATARKESIGDVALKAITCINPGFKSFVNAWRGYDGPVRQISIRRLPSDLYTNLRIIAIRDRTTMKGIVAEALRDYLDPIWNELEHQIQKGLDDATLLHKTGSR